MRVAAPIALSPEQRATLKGMARQRSLSARVVERARDNYATRKHPKVQRWLGRHPRFHMHFTRTSYSCG
jgi:hypothetical protein